MPALYLVFIGQLLFLMTNRQFQSKHKNQTQKHDTFWHTAKEQNYHTLTEKDKKMIFISDIMLLQHSYNCS